MSNPALTHPSQRLQHLLASRQDLWQGQRKAYGPVIHSGRSDLDQSLPGGGWPCGRLIELLPSLPGAGEFGLLLPALAHCSKQAAPVVLVAPPLVPCPQALQEAGVALDQLWIVHRCQHSLWAAEQLLSSALCAAVIIWHPPQCPKVTTLRRLQLAAEHSPTLSALIYAPHHSPPPLSGRLRLRVEPGPRWQHASSTQLSMS